jgi:branched-subunit amino acid ABC-type transport system permease component
MDIYIAWRRLCIGGYLYRMETFTVSVGIYIAWRRLLYRWIFISHGDVYCIGGYLYRMETFTVSVDIYIAGDVDCIGGGIYIAWRRLLYRWVFINK